VLSSHRKPEVIAREEDILAGLVRLEKALRAEALRLEVDIARIAPKSDGHGIATQGKRYRLDALVWVLDFLVSDVLKGADDADGDGRVVSADVSGD
jgi:hypothetical protein